MKSLFARHLNVNHHTFNIEEGFKVLHICQKGFFLDLLESLEMAKVSTVSDVVCLNDQVRHSSTPFFNSLLFSQSSFSPLF